jgi:pseudouridine-5'-phosphate glycosidase
MIDITYSKDVAAARDAGQPIVALESTIITHGMPWPQNLEVAQQVERTVREGGAVPATIAVLDGTLHVGLDDDQLTKLAQQQLPRR